MDTLAVIDKPRFRFGLVVFHFKLELFGVDDPVYDDDIYLVESLSRR